MGRDPSYLRSGGGQQPVPQSQQYIGGQPSVPESQQYIGGQPPVPQSQQYNPVFSLGNPNLFLQTLAHVAAQNPYPLNPYFPIQNSFSPCQYPNNFPIHQQQNVAPNSNFYSQQQNAAPAPDRSQYSDNKFSPQQQNSQNATVVKPNASASRPKFPNVKQSVTPSRKETLEKIELAVAKVRRNLAASEEHVSAWKVSQAVLVELQVESWDTLGFQLQEVPSLNQLILIEAKINAFIHCYVAVSRIITLYDIEAAICSNEGIENFKELELGPLVRHPLAAHYFSVKPDVLEVYRITSEEIIYDLIELVSRGRRFQVEVFLDYIAKKHEVTHWERMGLRIHGLGMYINRIREAQSSSDTVLRKCLEKVKNNSGKKSNSSKKGKKRPLFASRKKELDERFNVMTERVTMFSSMDKEFCGKHIRFVSSSSDDDDDGMDDYRSEENEYSCGGLEQSQFVTPKTSHDGVSSCPYPSVAEEMTRLGLSSEVGGSGHNFRSSRSNEPTKKKRKLERQMLHGKKKTEPYAASNVISEDGKMPSFLSNLDLSLDNDSLQIFVTTWKEACWEHSASEVFVRMFQCYKPRRRLDLFLSSYPFLGLLNVAVKSIKNKLWDSIYDAFQSIGEVGQTHPPTSNCVDSGSLDDSSNEKEPGPIISQKLGRGLCMTVEDIMKKAGEYFVLEKTMFSGITSLVEKLLMFSWKLCNCEVWLTKQLSVKDFRSLGHGDFFAFLRKHSYLLPEELLEFVNTEMCQGMSVMASMSQQQFVTLLSQASVGLWEDESLTTQKISDLLGRQFPQISFKVTENCCTQDLLNIMRQHRSSAPFNCVLFSATLLATSNHVDSVHSDVKDLFANNDTRDDVGQRVKSIQAVTANDAIEILLKAPMFSDLNLWSHWDMLYAPTFGPLLMWLMREVNVRDLLCLLTKDGKILRLDHLATVDSFFQALIEGYAFQVAVQLLSVLAVFGGKRHLPLSLLKCHACQAFEVIMMNGTSNTRIYENAGDYVTSNSCKNLSYSDESASIASRLVIDCLGYVPSEFREFAADILLCGLKSVVKDAYPAVLRQCKQKEERLMVHEIGLSLGIMEWIQDHHAVCPITDDVSWVSVCSLVDKVAVSKGITLVSSEKDEHCQEYSNVIMSVNGSEVDGSGKEGLRHVSGLVDQKDAAHIVKSIRREEFGLDSDLSNEENSVLEKLNARLGRALNCLSRELYSQDSHFLLELVQNADDNVYPRDVEPTLAFILQESGIVVMNNELGFTAQNIRALCDVGNSTKKGSSVGYIGKKGIGFKSVFRVTDAPEIHSNGFHVKFDITEGQIGFVLPTIIPPCDIDSFRQLVSLCSDHMDDGCWNTCIVLPFRSKFSESASVGSVFSMFSDLHPSLLLFLHRLKCIKLRNMLNNSYIVMRKEVVGDGIVEVSHENEKMTWFLASKKLHSEIFSSNAQNTEISIAFTLREAEDGGYDPYPEQQPVFSFLPLRAYGLKFILQGDFVLPSSREEVDGDSPWNQWLLSEVPDLFVSAEKCFSAIPCFLKNPAKAISAYMSFVPLVGEVHGFFSGLPRMIISKLRITSCLLEDGCKNLWVPPCKLLRNWNNQAILLLPNNLLHEHLGLGFLHRDIALSDALARALGIIEYGPKILVQFMSSLCNVEKGIKSMGLNWLSCWLNELHNMLSYSSGHNLQNPQLELDLVNRLKKVPFIPLSDGTYSSLDAGMIWVQADSDDRYEAFPNLYATLRIVSPVLISVATEGTSSGDVSLTNNILRMLQKIGIQRLSAHDIIKAHIVPAITDVNIVCRDKHLMTEYMAFLMFHLQSSCVDCHVEREEIFSLLRNGAFILTNHGYRKPVEVPIHFGKEYGNLIEGSRLIDAVDFKWLEVDTLYIKHSVTGSLSCGMKKWREFFENLGVTDFVKLNQVKKSITDLSSTVLTQMSWDRDFVSPDMMATDWESEELTYLISMVSKKGNLKRSEYLLEILDTLWEKYFFDKVAGHISPKSDGNNICFKSSLIKGICDVPWVASTMDNELHCPGELFYDCDAVRSILGASAPYAVPKISSSKLVSDIGFKIQVTIDDVLSILQAWRKSKVPFAASVSQMCKLYTFLWNDLPTSRQKVLEALKSGPFIFVPYAADIKTENISTGTFLASEGVCWHDSTGALDHIKELNSGVVQNDGASTKTLCNLYPGLHDFFIKDCGVNENPSFHHYLLILKQLSSSQLPRQGAKSVFKVLLRWSEDLSCGALSSGDIDYLKGCLAESDCTVLPAMQDKWVSLHPSFGLVCWSDDDILKKEFKYSDNIEFLYFGALSSEEKEMLQTKVSILMQTLGISALSEVVTREAIYYGPADCSFKASLMAWALPFAQRYIFNLHPKKYEQVKMSVFQQVQHLRIVVVQKLFYRNVIKRCHLESKKRHECSSLLQGNVLYTTQASDSHTFFMEFSRLIFDGAPEFHLANFLHMIATMAESGSSEVQIEFFILNNQKMLKLPDGEHFWSLSSLSPCIEKEETGLDCPSAAVTEQSSLKSKKRQSTSSWPPVGWKTAPGFDPRCLIGLGTPSVSVKCERKMDRIENNCEDVASQRAHVVPLEIADDFMIEDETGGMVGLATEGATAREFWQDEPDIIYNQSESRTDESIVPVNMVVESHCPEDGPSKSSEKDQEQATRTGRLGELVAYRYFTGKNGESAVKWVNEDKETGLPYDIIIGKKESCREYIEVKATRYANKAWSIISTREWQFAAEKGDAFSVAHVILSGKDAARITIYKNPVKLCQLGKIRLAILMPKQHKA